MAECTGTANESRVKKTLLNARVNLIFYFLTLCLSFFSRKIFLDCLGADFVGLTGTLQNLLGFLNLAELGIGSAIGYVLYKPLFDRNQTKINEIISVMGYLYRWIGIVILGGGLILACFLPLIFPDSDTGFHLPLIYCAYFAFLASSLIGYFINYRQNLLGADQKNYVVTAYFQSATIIKTLIQMALAYYTGNLYLWVFIELTFGIIYSFILNWKINQTYPWLKADIALGKRVFKKYPEVMVKTKQLFVHRIIPFVQFQCTPFLIYAYVSLQIVAFYGNYTIILDKLTLLTNTVYGSITASVGNLIAEGNTRKIESVYWELLSVRYLIAGILAFSIYFIVQPFITLWLGESYLLNNTIVFLLVCNIFIRLTREAADAFLFGAGLFQDILAPIVEIVVYFTIAIVGGNIWGLPGILLGGIGSMFVIGWIWKPYFLFTRLFSSPLSRNILTQLKYLGIVVLSIILSYMFCVHIVHINPNHSFISFVTYCIVIFASITFTSCTLMFACSSGFRTFVSRFTTKFARNESR